MDVPDNETFQNALLDLERKNRACAVAPYEDGVLDAVSLIDHHLEELQGQKDIFLTFGRYLATYREALEAPLEAGLDQPWFPTMKYLLELLKDYESSLSEQGCLEAPNRAIRMFVEEVRSV